MPKPKSIELADKVIGKFLNITNPLKSEGDGNWKLRGDNSAFTAKDENEDKFIVHQFPIDSRYAHLPINFYFAINISIYANEEIHSLSIKILKEDTTKVYEENIIQTELLLRAEWSNEISDNTEISHAQPHWHIHSYKIDDLKIGKLLPKDRNTIIQLIELSESQEISESLDNGNTSITSNVLDKTPMFKFHLPMLAEWDKSAIVNINKKLDDSNLKTWLTQCLGYIKEQIEYILSRSSGA